MVAKEEKSQIFKLIFLALLILFVLSIISPISVLLGDRLISTDDLAVAEFIYKLGKRINFYNLNFDQRLAAIQVVKEERFVESEETSADKFLAGDNQFTSVLGASVTIPVLMYHYVRVNPNPADKVGFNLSVTPVNFASQMDYLISHGYHTITLDQLGAALLGQASLPAKPIVVTFDDGYHDSYTAAYPILKSRGLKAVSFVITGFVGGPNYLTWGEIDEMNKNGVFTFGSHTVDHKALTYLDKNSIGKEVAESKNTLETHLDYRVNWLAYPYGNVNDKVVKLVRQAGYIGAFGTNHGTYHDTEAMYTLPRIRIGGSDNVETFAAKLP